jgi:hypothetical protein
MNTSQSRARDGRLGILYRSMTRVIKIGERTIGFGMRR